MRARDVLEALLDKLRKNQNWCPFCGGEVAHSTHHNLVDEVENCPLKGRWFSDETENDDD